MEAAERGCSGRPDPKEIGRPNPTGNYCVFFPTGCFSPPNFSRRLSISPKMHFLLIFYKTVVPVFCPSRIFCVHASKPLRALICSAKASSFSGSRTSSSCAATTSPSSKPATSSCCRAFRRSRLLSASICSFVCSLDAFGAKEMAKSTLFLSFFARRRRRKFLTP